MGENSRMFVLKGGENFYDARKLLFQVVNTSKNSFRKSLERTDFSGSLSLSKVIYSKDCSESFSDEMSLPIQFQTSQAIGRSKTVLNSIEETKADKTSFMSLRAIEKSRKDTHWHQNAQLPVGGTVHCAPCFQLAWTVKHPGVGFDDTCDFEHFLLL